MTFNIQRFSTHDGPGVRTVVFLKGCTLRCPWCENPESQRFTAELFYDAQTCIGCMDCARTAGPGEVEVVALVTADGTTASRPRFNRAAIRDPDRYRAVCPTGALSVIGEDREIEELVSIVGLDSVFYGDEGGVTFSGGEPYAQPHFLQDAITRLFVEGFDIAIETSLQVSWEAIAPTVPMVSLFLADLKHVDPSKYRSATGGNLSVVFENFANLKQAEANVTVRVPIVPGFNDSPAEIAEIAGYAASLSNVDELHLLPYHTLGQGKYERLGRRYPMVDIPRVANERLEEYARLVEQQGLRVSIGG